MPIFVIGKTSAGSTATLGGSTVSGPPTAITDLAAAPASVTIDIDETTETVTLSWTKPAGILTQTIWQSFNGGPFMDLVTINDVPDEWDVEVAIGEYQWYITTTGAGGTSAPSNIVTLIAVTGSTVGAQPAVRVTTRLAVSVITVDGAIDVTSTATVLQWGDNAHGSHQAIIAVTGQDARDIVRAFGRGTVTVRIRNNADIAWYGTVEDWVISGTTVQIVAYGNWSTLSLVPYSEFWSSNKTSDWQRHPGMGASWPFGIAGAVAGDWVMDIEGDKIHFAPRMSYNYFNYEWGMMSFRIPNGGVRRRSIKQFQCSWTFAKQVDNPDMEVALFALGSVGGVHQLILDTATGAYGRWSLWTLNAPTTGSVSITFAEPDITELLLIVHATTDGIAFDDEHGQDWFDLRPRVLSTTAATVTPTAIMSDVLEHANTHNPGFLDPSTSQIATVTMDLANRRYEDADPADVLRELASLGVPGGSTPLDVGIGTTGLLYYRLPLAPGAADNANGRVVRDVYMPDPPKEARYSLNALVNAAYGTYDTDYGTERTTPTTDTTSITRFGRKRMKPIEALTGSAQLQPQQLVVSDNATPRPAVEVSVTTLFDGHKNPLPLWQVHCGDWLVIESTQLGLLSDQVLDLRIRIIETRYDGTTDTLTLTLENSPPRLDVILGQLMLDQ